MLRVQRYLFVAGGRASASGGRVLGRRSTATGAGVIEADPNGLGGAGISGSSQAPVRLGAHLVIVIACCFSDVNEVFG